MTSPLDDWFSRPCTIPNLSCVPWYLTALSKHWLNELTDKWTCVHTLFLEGRNLLFFFFITIWRCNTHMQTANSNRFCPVLCYRREITNISWSLWHNSSSIWIFFLSLFHIHSVISFIHLLIHSFAQKHFIFSARRMTTIHCQQSSSVFHLPFQMLIFLLFCELVDDYIVKLFPPILSILHSLI